MTRIRNARVAGFAFLLYFAAGIASMVLFGRATGGEGIAAQLAGIAQHVTEVRVVVLLNLLTSFCALTLGVTLYGITREQDPDLATMGMVCRVVEGVSGAMSVPRTLALLSLATATGAHAPGTEATHAVGAFLLRGAAVGGIFFAAGSLLFSYLLLRGRMIPVALAWIGVLTSVWLVVGLPLLLAGFLPRSVTWYLWLPMAAFEIPFAVWLLLKGVSVPRTREIGETT